MNTDNDVFETGDRVITPGGLGNVVYKRMSAPGYNTVAAYCVKLDAAIYNHDQDSVYPAKDVKRIPISDNNK